MKSRNKKRPQISPRTLRKASRSRAHYEQTLEVAGKREQTKTGYRIPGTSCKEYETFFEHIAERQATDKMLHDKKTRTYRVVSGRGFAMLEKNDQQKSVVLIPGTELTVEPGITYVLTTTSQHSLEVFVSQSSKYESRLNIVESTETQALLDPKKLQSLSQQQVVSKELSSTTKRSRRSKAAAQQLKLRQARGQAAPTPAISPSASQNDRTFAANIRPTYGADLRGEPG